MKKYDCPHCKKSIIVDHFEQSDIHYDDSFVRPCNVCLHNQKEIDEFPCCFCIHGGRCL